ncbi:hypothetical protein QOZ98_002034 [Planomicrobium stackebrandtii]|uniref:Uncharacterized protein n=1 Tax=Planomicrobium stackebrandtii TaxID=253160 RepID=A0ABU0GV25_9BACL|nr:hypothetical protein [Planomicrobium stackebrandtii]MDQ0429206.1 hypothetical protein [Planomicrobium stackebrandtii]
MTSLAPKKSYGLVYRFLVADFILRWIVVNSRQFDFMGEVLFWTLQLILIPSTIFLFTDSYARKHKVSINEDELKYTTVSTFVTSFIIFSITTVAFYLYEDIHIFWRLLLSITTFLCYGFYIIVINENSLKKPKPNMEADGNLTDPTDASGQTKEQTEFDTYSNDIDLVRLEGMLNYTNDRINSYILESALFSGLAFAGFITLITSNKILLTDISALLNSLKGLLKILINFDLQALENHMATFSHNDLFVIILIESLFCTLSFISVIASRLRFSDILEEIDISVKMARSFNDKEEEVVLLNLERNKKLYHSRISYLNQKIDKEILIANQKLDSIKPILNAIRITRSFGMLFFFSMIFTSALLINARLALFVVLISLLVAVIMNIDHSRRIKKLRKLNLHLPKSILHKNNEN